uniref:alpha/beta hydrolase family protein n=1 Tax=Castellaniella defragrans TaxID=75697 RepID=UPI003341ED11
MPESIIISAADGYPLGGFAWRHAQDTGNPSPVAIINPATSVRCRYYSRFAEYLHGHGWDVITYDYRGIGESRQGSLRGFDADWIDWGQQDFEGVLRYAALNFPGQPIDIVGHSVGGFVIGMAQSAGRIRRIFTMGSQFAYWRDYLPEKRRGMYLKWHLLMPVLAHTLGYIPAKRLGWMEDTPKGVALNWARMTPRFEDSVRRGARTETGIPQALALARNFECVTAPILALGAEDDPYGTASALNRLLRYYRSSERRHLRIDPRDVGVTQIGHFAFFHERFRDVLWPYALKWLQSSDIPEGFPGSTQIMQAGR